MRRLHRAVAALLMVAVLFSLAAMAGEKKEIPSIGDIHDRWLLSLGVFLPYYNTDAQINSSNDAGTGVDLEDDLGFKANDSVFRLDGLFRISRRHQVGFTWFRLDRTSAKSIEKQIEWDDLIFDVGVDLKSHFNVDVYQLRYRFLVIQGTRLAVGVEGGVNLMNFDFGLEGQGRIAGDGEEETYQRAWSTSPLVPVPSLGVNARWAILGNLFLGGSLNYLKGSYDEQEARYSDLFFSLNWFPWHHVGFGIMYDMVKITYQDHGREFHGRLDYRYSGPVLALNIIF